MQREARKYLSDIHQAVTLLAEFTAGKQFSDCERDAMLRAAVEREFESPHPLQFLRKFQLSGFFFFIYFEKENVVLHRHKKHRRESIKWKEIQRRSIGWA